jgi:hypothetical protein
VTGEAGDAETSAGRYLARQRRLRDISLDELAARTKIPRRSLERLESGAFDGQADGFVRGFVRTVAEALGLDPNDAVMRLLREPPATQERARAPWAARLGLALALLAGLALLALTLLAGGRALRERFATGGPEVVYREDAVRSLAEERREAVGPEAEGVPPPSPDAGAAAPAAPAAAAPPEAAPAPAPAAAPGAPR